MDAVKILHCGDLHFDTPFQGFTPMEAEKRKEDLRETFGRIIDLVKAERILVLLLAGDIFDNDGVTKMTMEHINKKLREIADTKVFIAPGNHDYYSHKSFYSLYPWPGNVHIFKDKIEKVTLPEYNTCVYGIGFSGSHERQSIIKNFKVDEEKYINIMVLHGDVIGRGQASDYNPITENEIESTALDYLALGHKHGFSGIKKAGQTHWAYSGNPEGRGFDELGSKGVILGEVGKNWCSLDFKEMAKRKYSVVEVDISDAITNEDIVIKVKESIDGEERSKNLYKIILVGEVDKELSIYISVIESKLEEDFYFVKVEDETNMALDYEQLEKEYSLKGIYTRKIREKILESQGIEDLDLFRAALKIGLEVLDKGKVDIK